MGVQTTWSQKKSATFGHRHYVTANHVPSRSFRCILRIRLDQLNDARRRRLIQKMFWNQWPGCVFATAGTICNRRWHDVGCKFGSARGRSRKLPESIANSTRVPRPRLGEGERLLCINYCRLGQAGGREVVRAAPMRCAAGSRRAGTAWIKCGVVRYGSVRRKTAHDCFAPVPEKSPPGTRPKSMCPPPPPLGWQSTGHLLSRARSDSSKTRCFVPAAPPAPQSNQTACACACAPRSPPSSPLSAHLA